VGETARFQETLRKLAMIDEAFVRDQTGLGLDPAGSRALAAGATDDEIADMLLVIAPITGLGRVVCAAPDVAAALGYDISAALEDPDDQ